MKENSDKNRYAANPRIDEWLNSFIDGELPAAQQAQVERLITDDAQIARRLRQLQRCKMLVGSLPYAEVPAEVSEGIKASLAKMTMPDEKRAFSERAGNRRDGLRQRHVLVRRVLSAAAIIGLAAVLAVVIYTILTPQTGPERPLAVKNKQGPGEAEGAKAGPGAVAVLGLSGRLELKTDDVAAVSAFVKNELEDSGFLDSASPAGRQDRRIYSLSCSRKDLHLLLARLETIWPELESAALFVNTEVFGEPVVINAVTTQQIAQIAEQNTIEKRIEVAKDLAALNDIAVRLPGGPILSAIEGGKKDLVRQWRLPKPVETGGKEPSRRPPTRTEGQETVRLTIIVNW